MHIGLVTWRALSMFVYLSAFLLVEEVVAQQKIVMTNDDGWATAQIRSQYRSFNSAGFDVILSAPSVNNSGTGSFSNPLPLPLPVHNGPCEFNTCPKSSSMAGSNRSDERLNFFRSFPVDAARHGIKTLAPKFFGSKPDLLVSGPNVGDNNGFDVFVSGTIGAACEGETQGIPSVAFSGQTTRQVSFTTLDTEPDSPSTLAAHIYSALTTQFVNTLFSAAGNERLVPQGTIINVNYPALNFDSGSTCSKASDVKWVFSRLFPAVLFPSDVETCDNGGKLPDGAVVSGDKDGCFASVIVLDRGTKLNAGKDDQEKVLISLEGLGLSCYDK